MEEHYIKDVGKITYVYGVNLEEHKTVIEKQQKRIAELEKQLDQLKQQLEEKDKEIELLKHLGNHETATEMFKENAKLIIEKRQLAIQELEKVKEEMDLNGNSYCEIRQGTSPHNPTDYAWFNYVKFRNYLNQQIKELKGEKDVED